MEYIISKLSTHKNETNYEELCKQLYYITDHLSQDYPQHKDWFFNKHIPQIGNGREVIYITAYGNICGVAFLKNTVSEKKICTFYVAEYSRNIGIGSALLKASFGYLQTERPLISMPKYKVRFFLYYVYKYDWKITQILSNYYNNENDEVVFNGNLI